jgi:transcriptional regulator with XRE-family HTH domain
MPTLPTAGVAVLATENPVTLAVQLSRSRSAAGLTQAQLAAALGKKKQAISEFENGVRVPHLRELVVLHRVLYQADDDDQTASLADWILKWVGAHAEAEVGGLDTTDKARLEAAVGALDGMRPAQPKRRESAALSLADFPDAFAPPLTVICGDRRETEDHMVTAADLFAYSLAVTDIYYLPLLRPAGGAPKVLSDKLALLMDQAFLEQELGSDNLLIIGSPAVNWAARIVNDNAIFRFDTPQPYRDWQRRYRLEPELQDEETVRFFRKIVEAVEEGDRLNDPDGLRVVVGVRERDQNSKFQVALELARELLSVDASPEELTAPKHIMNQFRRAGIVDPADGRIQAVATRANNDFAMVSIAVNPWDESGEHVAVVVAGIHGPGTAHALRELLENPAFFRERPYGGVIEITLPGRHAAWPTQFRSASCSWQTHPYDAARLIAHFERSPIEGQQEPEWLTRYAADERERMLALIARLASGYLPEDSLTVETQGTASRSALINDL